MMQTFISGYCVKVEHNGIPYTIHTKQGFRGINIPCLAWVEDRKWCVFVKGERLEVKMVVCDLRNIVAHEFSKQN
jgi:hypothetical protein